MSYLGEYDLAEFEDNNGNAVTQNYNYNLSDNLHSSGDGIIITNNASQNKDFNSVTKTDSAVDDEEVLENGRNWVELPSLAVENIYSFLSRTDQSRMSSVCSRWAKDFNSPCLWKTMKFYLPEHDYSSEIYPEVRFARKYASMFRHVEIICKTVRNNLIVVIWKQLKLFLQTMASSSQLTSIKFINMGNYFRRLRPFEDILHEDLFNAIVSFFNSQKNLKTIVFHESRFSKEEGLELMKAIFHSDCNIIKKLTLRGFVNEAPVTISSRQYKSNLKEVCCKISNVQSLEVDYTQIFEDIINCLYEKLTSGHCQSDKKKPNTSTLNIHCEDEEQSGFRGILPRTWKYFKNVFPGLKVKMDITIHNHLTSEMEKFLVKEIPLKTLEFRFDNISISPPTDISALFAHLQACKYQDHLEVLNILWMASVADFSGSVSPFFQSCKRLQHFHLHVRCTPSETENVLKAIFENHPSQLKSMTIWLKYNQENEEEDNLRVLSEEYYQLFLTKGIECFLVTDPNR